MSYPLPTGAPMTPPVEFIEEVCGIYFRSIRLEKAGYALPQHAHDHDHATFCGRGAARAWADGKWIGDVREGHAIAVKAGAVHTFQALEDGTILSCVHDVASAMSIKEKF